ncbi:DNA circularization N-terminal domain-containing protein [Haemophilus influenzae]|nr:DNA circularization N-terminal domain-containing protein [Haemophilus influenzae]MCK9110992.1 DNA circularization N-terminal domain-containing protein [Haemophilus influenzae]MCK9121653.1 DNA circularization N-terminal domain-containing protein [Haemophilus influenzae]
MSKMRQKSGKGSFRGVPFLIEDEQGMDGGRRLVRYEYPLRDDGMTEDLGLRLRNYHISCLVIGDDHVKQAEKLIEALEKPGTGTLKHPYFGTKEVRVDDYKAVYSTGHLRVTRFDISFIPAINEIAPLAKKDSLFGVLNQYADALNALADEFAEMIEGVLDFIDELTAPIFNLVDSFIGLIETVFDGIGAVLAVGSEFKNRVMGFKNRLSTLIRTPQLFAKELQSLVQFGRQGVAVSASGHVVNRYYGGLQVATAIPAEHSLKNAVDTQRVFVQMSALSDAMNQAKTKLQQRQLEMPKSVLENLRDGKTNQQSIHKTLSRNVMAQYGMTNILNALQAKAQFVFLRLMQTTLVVEYGKAIAQAITMRTKGEPSTIESRADVQRYLRDIDEQLERAIFDCADHEQWQSYEALEQFRLALLLDLRARGELLAESKMVDLTDTQPALVVTFNETGKAKGWERVVRRNQIRHPLFCLGGSQVEVLA